MNFDVYRDGHIDKITVRTNPPESFNIVEEAVEPEIKILEGSPILMFPKDSKRQKVTYSRTFSVSDNPYDNKHYTTPSEFQDYEKVK